MLNKLAVVLPLCTPNPPSQPPKKITPLELTLITIIVIAITTSIALLILQAIGKS